MATARWSPAGSAPLAGTADAADDRRASRWFVHLVMVTCLLLQRFCVFIGGGAIYFALFAFLGGIGWMLIKRRARVRPISAWLFGSFVVVALLGTLLALNDPDPRISGLSLPSLASVLLVYVGLAIVPTERFDRSATFDIFVLYVRWCALFGIVQYWIQFAGIRVFAFGDVLPALNPILAERLFNSHPVIAYGSSILRSNGFFLAEPSIFSQLLVIGIVTDVFVREDWRFLPLYAAAYLFTYAGTGLLAFAIAAPLSVLLTPRTSLRLVGLLIGGAVLAGIAAVAVPDALASLTGRASELQYSGSSGYARYVGQVDLINAFIGETRNLIGYGPGALERASVSVAGSINPALKLGFEYGFIGLALFALFLVSALWRREIGLLSLVLLVNYQLGGGYLLFMPFVILSAMLCIWSEPRPRREARGVVA